MGEHWLFSLVEKNDVENFLGVKWKIINVYFVQSVFRIYTFEIGGCVRMEIGNFSDDICQLE